MIKNWFLFFYFDFSGWVDPLWKTCLSDRFSLKVQHDFRFHWSFLQISVRSCIDLLTYFWYKIHFYFSTLISTAEIERSIRDEKLNEGQWITFSYSIFSFFQHLRLKYTNIWALKKFQKANFILEQFEKGAIFASFVPIRLLLNLTWHTISDLNISKLQNQFTEIPKTMCSPMLSSLK